MSPHLVAAWLDPASPGCGEGGGWSLTQPRCTSVSLFLQRFPSIPAPDIHLSAPELRHHDTLYRKKGRAGAYPPPPIPRASPPLPKATVGLLMCWWGVMTQEVWLSHCEKLSVGVGVQPFDLLRGGNASKACKGRLVTLFCFFFLLTFRTQQLNNSK